MVIPLQDQVTMLLIFVNIILTVSLAYIYMKNYRTISSKMTLGLLIFSGFFLVENVLNFYFYGTMILRAMYGITIFHLTVNFIEMIGLGALLYITWKT